MQQNEPKPWREVPVELAELLRPELAATVDEIIAAVRAEVPEYDQPLEGEFGRLISDGVALALDQFVDLLGSDSGQPDTAIYEAMGRAEVEAGRTLDALQSAYRTGARVAWRRVVRDAGDRLPPEVMYVLAEAIFAFIDRLADASVAGYAAEQSAREGFAQARRQALVEDLLSGPVADEDALREAALRAGWDVPKQLLVVALGAEDDAVTLARRAPSGTIGARVEDGALLVVGDPDGPGRRRALVLALATHRAVIGPAVPWTRAYLSAERARLGAALQRRGRLGAGLVDTEDHLLDLLLGLDPALAADLVARRLGPLGALKPGPRARAVQTLRAWLDAHGDVSATAVALHVHPQTVRYRLSGLRDLYDEDLDDPVARLEIAVALHVQSGA